MAERQIGLSGELDLSGWSKNVHKYNSDLTGMVGNTSKAAGGFGTAWNTIGQSVLKATGIMTGALAAGAAAAGAAIVGVGVSAFNASAEFEAATQKMTAQLGLTEVGAQQFDETMRKVFANNFGESIDDVAQSLVDVEMAFGRIGGTEGAGELQFATEAAIALRDAFGVEVVESTDAAVTLMDQFGISSEQAFDLLTAGFQNGLNSSDDFLDTIGEYSTQFANGGASVEEFFGLMKTGLQGGMLGTDKAADAFKEFQVRILDGSTATADALALLGINADEFTGKIASGEMTISEAFTKITQKFHTVEDQAVLMQAGVGLLGTQFEDLGVDGVLALDMLNTSFADVSGATASLNVQYATFGQAVAGMWRRLVVAITPFTDVLLDLVNKAMPHVMAAFDSFEKHLATLISYLSEVASTGDLMNDWLDKMSPPLATVVRGTIDLAGAIGGTLMSAFSFIQEHADAFRGALLAIAAVLAAATITAGITAMAAAIASLFNPITLIILAAAGLGVAWNTNFLGIRDTTASVVSALQAHLGPLLETLQTLGSGILTTIRDHWQEIAAGVTGFAAVLAIAKIPAAFAAISAAVSGAGAVIGATLAAINLPLLLVAATVGVLAAAWVGNWWGMRDATTAALAAIQEAFTPLTEAIAEFGSGALGEIQAFVTGNETEFTNLKAIWDGLAESIGGIVAKVQEQFPQLAPIFVGFGVAVQLISLQVQAQLTLLSDAFSALVTGISALVTGDWATAWQSAQDLVGAFVTYVETTFTNVGTVFSGLATIIAEHLPGWQAALGEWGAAAWQWLQDAAGQLLLTLGGWALVLTTYVSANLPIWQASLAAWATAAWQWIVDAIPLVTGKLGEWGTAVLGYVTDNLPTWTENLAGWTTAAWQWIVDAVAPLKTQLGTWGQAILNYAINNLPQWTANLLAWGKAAWEWIVSAASIVKTKLGEWGKVILDYVVDNLPTWTKNLADWAKAAWEWIVDAVKELPGKLGEWYTALTDYLGPQLGIWKTEFTEWTKAAWQWIIDAVGDIAGKLAEWYTAIETWFTDNYPTFEAKANEWSLALYNWITSDETKTNTEDALDEWKDRTLFEKIKAFDDQLAIKMFDLEATLYGWIGEAIPATITAITDWLIALFQGVDPNSPEVNPAVLDAQDRSREAFDDMIEAISISVEENAVKIGQAVLDGFIEGINDWVPETKLDEWTKSVIQAVMKLFGVQSPSTVFHGIGKDLIQGLIDGMWAMVNAIVSRIGDIKIEMIKAFATVKSWIAAGKAIIEGVLKGLQENGQQIIDYIFGLGQGALDSIKGLFGMGGSDDNVGSSSVMENVGQGLISGWLDGMSGNAVSDRFAEMSEDALGTITDFWEMRSPSKRMIGLGKDIIDGWIIGMQSRQTRLHQFALDMANSLARIAERSATGMIDAFSGALNKFSTIAGGKMDTVDLLDRFSPTGSNQWIATTINQQRSHLNFLQQQADLVAAIRETGADPQDVLAGITLGFDADPAKMAEVIATMMQRLNIEMERQLKNVNSGLDKQVEEMRAKRRSVADIEEQFAGRRATTIERLTDTIAGIDQQIADMEINMLRGGNRQMLIYIKQAENRREAILSEIETILEQQKTLDALLARQPVSTNQRAQDAIDRWRERMIDPLLNSFDLLSAASRANTLAMVEKRMATIAEFAAKAPMITQAEGRAMKALEGFGEGAQRRAENLLAIIYNPNNLASIDRNISGLHEFANGLNDIRHTLELAAHRRLSTETIMERMLGSFDQLTAYKNAIAAIDRQIESAQAAAFESGQMWGVWNVQNLDVQRERAQAELETFIRQNEKLKDIMGQVKNLSGPGQNAAQRFLQEAIQPIMDAFSAPMRAVDREAWLKTAQDRVKMLNRFVDQMRALERVQARVAGNEFFAHLEDDFARLQDINLPEATRVAMIGQLDRFITQMMRLQDIQRDITIGRGINPIVERFASDRLDAIAQKLQDINLTEAQRNQLIEQYRVEQEKILRLQEKQQQLTFIQEQLALIKQLRDLDDLEGWSLNVDSIIRGIQFGVNASIDDLMRLTGRVLDELVRYANHELGIASPSKVFAKMGNNIMAGLEQGILAGMRYPMNALRNATGNLVPYSLGSRTLSVNMGGVTISNGMDDVMFEARVRQIVQSEFAR